MPEGQAGKGAGLSFVIKALETLSAVFLIAMMVLTFVDVVGRYLFGSPVFGANEMISSLLALLIFAGLGVCNARDDHIVVELLDHRVRRLSPRVYEVVIQGFSVVVMLIVAFVLLEIAWESWSQGAKTIVMEIPLAWIAVTVSVLALLSVVSQVMGLVVRGRGK